MRLTLLALLVSSLSFAHSPAEQKDALNLDWRNTTIKPEDNFFAYANGSWQTQNPIPPEYASWGVFNMLDEKVQHQLHDILKKAAQKQAKPGSITQKVGDFFYSGMDEKAINEAGLKPLEAEFSRINNIKNLADLQKVISHLHLQGVGALFAFGSMQDFKDSNLMIAAAYQGGLGLPTRDYYLEDKPEFVKVREAYINHIEKMFLLMGKSSHEANNNARKIMALETALAKASLSNTAMRDPLAVYHMVPVKKLETMSPHFSWSNYFKEIKLPDIQSINLATPQFFQEMNYQLKNQPINTWKAYLTWHLLDTYAAALSDPFVNEDFHMAQVLNGAKQLLPRWKRVIKAENQALGFAIGKLYVKQHFSKEDKKQVQRLIDSMRKTLAEDLKTLPWMTPATREAALAKLDKMKDRIGYPTVWWDYSPLSIDRGPYVLNVMRGNQFITRRDLNKIGKPVDRTEWAMTPQTVNAYYDPSMNNINLPAAILQPPMFNAKAPDAVNYGAIGSVIGHEIIHGFDDQGAKFDGDGNLKNWWTATDAKSFQAATRCISDQFSGYKVGKLSVKGDLVLGEATADLGGLSLAWKAYSQSPAFKDAPAFENLTPAQQFFLSAAHVWSNNIRPEQARHLVTTDPHPPAMYRVNGTLANMPAFFSAFNIEKTGAMRNEKPCVVW